MNKKGELLTEKRKNITIVINKRFVIEKVLLTTNNGSIHIGLFNFFFNNF